MTEVYAKLSKLCPERTMLLQFC